MKPVENSQKDKKSNRKQNISKIFLSGLGGAIAIGCIGFLAYITNQPLILGSFGASCVLIFGFPKSPFSQPRNVIGGHLIASFIGLLCLNLFGDYWWSMALALGLAISFMMLTDTVHPPAGSNPVIVMLGAPNWNFLLEPTLIGAILLVAIGFIFNNITTKEKFPEYWFKNNH